VTKRDPFLWKCIEFHVNNLESFKLNKLWKYVELKHGENTEKEFEKLKKELIEILEEK